MTQLPELPKGQRIGGQDRATLRARMVAAYKSGSPIRDIAAQTGRSYGFVHRVLGESGTAFRTRGGNQRGGKHHKDDQQ